MEYKIHWKDYNGKKRTATINRGEDGRVQCPCRNGGHDCYDANIIYKICKLKVHPPRFDTTFRDSPQSDDLNDEINEEDSVGAVIDEEGNVGAIMDGEEDAGVVMDGEAVDPLRSWESMYEMGQVGSYSHEELTLSESPAETTVSTALLVDGDTPSFLPTRDPLASNPNMSTGRVLSRLILVAVTNVLEDSQGLPHPTQTADPFARFSKHCKKAGCQFPYDSSGSHGKAYHSEYNRIWYCGKQETMRRQADDKIPCPCGAPPHARHNHHKVSRQCKLPTHPDPSDGSQYPDTYGDDALELARYKSMMQPVPHASHIPQPLLLPPRGRTPIEGDNSIQPFSGDVVSGPVRVIPPAPVPPPLSSQNSFPAPASPAPGLVDTHISLSSPPLLTSSLRSNDELLPDRGELQDNDELLPDDDELLPGNDNDNDDDNDDESLSEYDRAIRQLRKLQTVVVQYNRTACLQCLNLVRWDNMHSHQRTHLPARSRGCLPLSEVFQKLLCAARADNPEEFGSGPIQRLDYVKDVEAYKCAEAGCGVIKGAIGTLRTHQREAHVIPKGRSGRYAVVKCHETDQFNAYKNWVEILPTEAVTPSDIVATIKRAAKKDNLYGESPSSIFQAAQSVQEKNVLYGILGWDEHLQGTRIRSIRLAASASHHTSFPCHTYVKIAAKAHFQAVGTKVSKLQDLTLRRIRSDVVGYVLSTIDGNTSLDLHSYRALHRHTFKRPQESRTMDRYASFTARFISFLLIVMENPIAGFPVPLHPETERLLRELQSRVLVALRMAPPEKSNSDLEGTGEDNLDSMDEFDDEDEDEDLFDDERDVEMEINTDMVKEDKIEADDEPNDGDHCGAHLLNVMASIHDVLWSLLCQPSEAYCNDAQLCPLKRFIIASHLQNDDGQVAEPAQIPPNIAAILWCLRGTAVLKILGLRGKYSTMHQ
ncbi:hypothetical protein AAF712_015253 [Marasmius tenuissimus]|uniref:C2H2-type domain-containing protein n=1 Tax=Marasmius tenuissimus TaxID=585030 RepID=A0ABR2Z9W5_9AGAR